ncbi:MAG: Fe(2+)-trafficking protein [Nitrospiria bacterium]
MAEVSCTRCGQCREAIEGTPYGGKIGQTLKEKICNSCWQEWYAQSIKIINEYRVSLRDQKGRDFLATQMKIFLKLEAPEGETAAPIEDTPPSSSP